MSSDRICIFTQQFHLISNSIFIFYKASESSVYFQLLAWSVNNLHTRLFGGLFGFLDISSMWLSCACFCYHRFMRRNIRGTWLQKQQKAQFLSLEFCKSENFSKARMGLANVHKLIFQILVPSPLWLLDTSWVLSFCAGVLQTVSVLLLKLSSASVVPTCAFHFLWGPSSNPQKVFLVTKGRTRKHTKQQIPFPWKGWVQIFLAQYGINIKWFPCSLKVKLNFDSSSKSTLQFWLDPGKPHLISHAYVSCWASILPLSSDTTGSP